jgi:hypothetical protein
VVFLAEKIRLVGTRLYSLEVASLVYVCGMEDDGSYIRRKEQIFQRDFGQHTLIKQESAIETLDMLRKSDETQYPLPTTFGCTNQIEIPKS